MKTRDTYSYYSCPFGEDMRYTIEGDFSSSDTRSREGFFYGPIAA